MTRSDLVLRVARAIHRALIRLLQDDVRRRYRGEITATFDAALADASAHAGVPGVLRLLIHEIADVVAARGANRPARLPAGVRHVPGRRGPDLGAWRQAWRSLLRRPAFFTAGVVTLAAGTGVITAVFALVDGVLVKPLPYPDGDRLVTIYESSPAARNRTSLVAPARIEDWQRRTRAFAAIAGSYAESVTDTSGETPQRLDGLRVTPRFFDVFAMPPLAGRTFVADEERPEGAGSVVISERFWTRRFQRDPAAIGRALIIGGRAYTIVGAMPAAFTSAATDVWLPAQIAPGLLAIRDARFLGGIGRLRAGATIEDGARDLAAVQATLATEFPATDAGWSAEVRALKDVRIGDAASGLILLAGAVASLWLIALSNAVALTLVHVRRRSRELAIRTALGASRGRVLGVLLREAAIVGAIGGALGLALAAWAVPALRLVLTEMPRIEELALDGRAVVFGGGSLLVAVVLIAVVPALAGARRRSVGPAELTSRTGGGGRHRVQHALVVAQVALSVVLVGSAALLTRSYLTLVAASPGFDPAGVVTFRVGARWDEDRIRIGQMQRDLLARVRELPHVQAAGLTNFLPATGATLRYQLVVEGVPGSNADGSITVGARTIDAGYLETLRAPLLAGGWCPDEIPAAGAPRGAILNRRFVEVHAPGQSMVGRSARLITGSLSAFTIVGIVDDLAEDGPGTAPVPYLYACLTPGAWPDPEYVVRTTNPAALPNDLTRIVRDIDPGRAIFGMRPLADVFAASLDRPRFDATSVALFAGTALALAALGLYGLFTLVVSDRARDIAVRFALGAAPRDVMRLVLQGAGRLLALGLGLGIALMAIVERLFRSAVFQLGPFDPLAMAAAVAVLATVSAAAVMLPARRAAQIDPLVALRSD